MKDFKTANVNLLGNPRFKEFIEAFQKISQEADRVSLDEGRKLGTRFFLSPGTIFEPVHRIEDCQIEGTDLSKIPLRIYMPISSGKLPALVYFHRGGWVFGNIEEADPVCRKLANHLKCIVISVDYRLAPEHPFPKPLNDCYDATLWVSKNIGNFCGDASRLIVCGESAGGNIAAAVALMARDKEGPQIAAQTLIYPAISSTLEDASYAECADQYFLTKETMQFFWDMYLQNPEDKKNPYASLELSLNLRGLPPAVIITAEHDPLHNEAVEYARALSNENVKTLFKCFPDVIHGFIDLPIYDEQLKIGAIEEIGKLLSTFVDMKPTRLT